MLFSSSIQMLIDIAILWYGVVGIERWFPIRRFERTIFDENVAKHTRRAEMKINFEKPPSKAIEQFFDGEKNVLVVALWFDKN